MLLTHQLTQYFLGRFDCLTNVFGVVSNGDKQHFKLGRSNIDALLAQPVVKCRESIQITGFGIIKIFNFFIVEKETEHA